jgi:hypothetical protein
MKANAARIGLVVAIVLFITGGFPGIGRWMAEEILWRGGERACDREAAA